MNPEIPALSAELAAILSPDKIRAIADKISNVSSLTLNSVALDSVGSKKARLILERLSALCKDYEVSGAILAGMLLGASAAGQKLNDDQSVELVWTGPTTSYVATRQTEQVLLDLIKGAKRDIFIVSYVAHKYPSIVDALNLACQNGVTVRFLLEASLADGGSLDVDPVATMRTAVKSAQLYTWVDKSAPFTEGRVHAKIAIADGQTALLTSANLTGNAMIKNMEAGVLIRGGQVPSNLKAHLQALIDTNILKKV
jgi:phosphatidylserine/phosphatidylglycerophosphate/cardiolipin synthase-like enzyme